METRVVSGEFGVEEAVKVLASGWPVALPTETVYGLAANAADAEAVARVFSIKERPEFDPLIVHITNRQMLERIVRRVDENRAVEDLLMKKFWPGALTLVFPRRKGEGKDSSDGVVDLVTAGLETVAVRMSAHPLMRAVGEKSGFALAAPSANRFGRISPTKAEHVLEELGGKVPLILEGGETSHGVESTIVRVEGETLYVLRQGPVTEEMLAAFGKVISVRGGDEAGYMEAPGQMESHYAPGVEVVLRVAGEKGPEGIDLSQAGLLSWGAPEDREIFGKEFCLSREEELVEAAKRLFTGLRELDHSGVKVIVAELLPETGLGRAINDRLRRAAGKRTRF